MLSQPLGNSGEFISCLELNPSVNRLNLFLRFLSTIVAHRYHLLFAFWSPLTLQSSFLRVEPAFCEEPSRPTLICLAKAFSTDESPLTKRPQRAHLSCIYHLLLILYTKFVTSSIQQNADPQPCPPGLTLCNTPGT
jgi:hypothetical protein